MFYLKLHFSLLAFLFITQGSHRTWKTWKNRARPGKAGKTGGFGAKTWKNITKPGKIFYLTLDRMHAYCNGTCLCVCRHVELLGGELELNMVNLTMIIFWTF